MRTLADTKLWMLLVLGSALGCDDGANGRPPPSDEVCDGRDDDGDGRIDEMPPCNGCPVGTEPPAGWVCIPAGSSVMGSPEDELGRFPEESPQHHVQITRPFFAANVEVTQAQWARSMLTRPFQNPPCDDCPADSVTWFDSLAYANHQSRLEGLEPCYELVDCSGAPGDRFDCRTATFIGLECSGFRLPTEAEWEYMARAGTTSPFWFGHDPEDLVEAAWYDETTNRTGPRPVGTLAPNPWGLFDIYGNVLEWCHDWFADYPADAVSDPIGPFVGERRVARGGSWDNDARRQRSATRPRAFAHDRDERLGIRLIRTTVLP